jgi:RNA polymerase sigma-70 factor (ECF subfamily)
MRISVTNQYPEHSLVAMSTNTGGSVANLEIQSWTDEEVVARVLAGEPALFEVLMRRHNQRIYRIVRGILRDDTEAEDVMQDAYVRAYQHLGQFEGRSTFITWLSRIAMHEAFARARRLSRQISLDSEPEWSAAMNPQSPATKSPETIVANHELRMSLETAILSLPQKYRSVVILRDVEEMTTAEVAGALEISEDLVKVQLHRARALVRKALFRQSGQSIRELFVFPATRCDRVVAAVFSRI